MILESPQLPFWLEVLGNLTHWLIALGALGVVGFLLAYLISAVRFGPQAALSVVEQSVRGGLRDWSSTSFQRVFALSWLAFQESIRRRVLVVFVIFVLVLMVAGWYFDDQGDRAAGMYLNFVLTSISFLVIALAMVLSTFSLPSDIQNRTILTVVSKPVRRHEIVLGRVLGFTATGTILLGAMGLIGFYFVDRGLDHSHELRPEEIELVDPDPQSPNPLVKRGFTARKHGHRHEVLIYRDGTIVVDDTPGHTHEITVRQIQGKDIYEFSGPRNLLRARVPIYGAITYFDRAGEARTKGINVGKEWTYKSCIEGNTKCSALWNFTGLSKSDFPAARYPEGIPLEMSLGVFRTYKGDDVSKGILGSLRLKNPTTGRFTSPILFTAKEYYTQVIILPWRMSSPEGPLGIFEDLVDREGKLEIEVRCEERAQFYCMAGPDLYLRAGDAPFAWNYFKGFCGLWMQFVIVTAVGVCSSCVLRGSVALLLTVAFTVTGFFAPQVVDLAFGRNYGGGPVESLYRIVSGKNMITPLEKNLSTDVVKMVDDANRGNFFVIGQVVPQLRAYNDSDYLAQGFNIPAQHLCANFLAMLGFLIILIVLGHFGLRLRQVAQ